MKQTLKLILSALFGFCIGLSIVALCFAVFTDIPLDTFFSKLEDVKATTLLLSCLLSIIALLLALFTQIMLHEGGHLVCGLATGYQFVSFRIINLTLIKEKGRFRIKRFAIAGTAGQCLLSPPNKPHEQLPYFWYNAGGVLTNLLTATIALSLWFGLPDKPMFLNFFLLFSGIIGFFLAGMNGIPMKIGGVTNDAFNILLMRRTPLCRKHFASQLLINSEIQLGIRLKDMPADWFPEAEMTDYSNVLLISANAVHASRFIDQQQFEAAFSIFSNLMLHEKEMPALFAKECACELLFLELITRNRLEEVERLYTEPLQKYTSQYRYSMSSKQRLLCALALYRDHQPSKAQAIYEELLQKREKYLMQGEVTSDLEIMKALIDTYEAN